MASFRGSFVNSVQDVTPKEEISHEEFLRRNSQVDDDMPMVVDYDDEDVPQVDVNFQELNLDFSGRFGTTEQENSPSRDLSPEKDLVSMDMFDHQKVISFADPEMMMGNQVASEEDFVFIQEVLQNASYELQQKSHLPSAIKTTIAKQSKREVE